MVEGVSSSKLNIMLGCWCIVEMRLQGKVVYLRGVENRLVEGVYGIVGLRQDFAVRLAKMKQVAGIGQLCVAEQTRSDFVVPIDCRQDIAPCETQSVLVIQQTIVCGLKVCKPSGYNIITYIERCRQVVFVGESM